MTATYTFDVFCTLDGFGSYQEGADWGGYWGKQGPEFLERRLAMYDANQRMVLGGNTFRLFTEMLGPSPDEPRPARPQRPDAEHAGHGDLVDAGRTVRLARRCHGGPR